MHSSNVCNINLFGYVLLLNTSTSRHIGGPITNAQRWVEHGALGTILWRPFALGTLVKFGAFLAIRTETLGTGGECGSISIQRCRPLFDRISWWVALGSVRLCLLNFMAIGCNLERSRWWNQIMTKVKRIWMDKTIRWRWGADHGIVEDFQSKSQNPL
jgi:hypothetical protein